MSTRKEKTGWRRYLIFVLPFAGVAMVFLYLSVFNLFRYWNIAQTGTKPNEIKESFIKPLGVLRCVFEAPPLSPNPCGTLNGAITAKAVVVWGYATGLVAVALLFSALLAGYVVWHGPGRGARSDAARWTKRKRWLLTACVLLFSLLI